LLAKRKVDENKTNTHLSNLPNPYNSRSFVKR
jgi:hypothetical protein